MHVRKRLRDAVIVAINTVPNLKAEPVRGFGSNKSRLPIAEVSTPSEQAEGVTMDGMIARNIELLVVLTVAASKTPEDDADALSVAVEKAIYNSSAVMGLIQELTPESMAFEIAADGETRVGRMQLSWSAIVHTIENDPETAL